MEANEPGALAALRGCRRAVIDPFIGRNGGRIVKNTGDGVLVEFTSATDAVSCAIDIQRELAVHNAGLPEPERLVFRIGISAGEVIAEHDDIYGDNVNIAFRLQSIAEPGAVVVSGTAFEQIRKARLGFRFDDLGEQALKNLERKVRAYRVVAMANSTPLFLFAPSASEPPQPLQPPPVPTKPSIVVLPIVNMSGDPGQDYFADGFTDDVIDELGRFRSLLVIARTASYAWKGRCVEPGELRAKLGVQYALQGTLRRIGPRLRVSVELIRTDTSERFWGERYDAEADEVFTIQDQIVRALVGTLVGRVEAERLEQVRTKPPENLSAYDRLLRGLEYHRRCGLTRDFAVKAVEEFEAACRLDPSYARAHAWHACALASEWFRSDSGWVDRCCPPVERAFELDENDPEVNRILGAIRHWQCAFEQARFFHRRARDLNPNDAAIAAVCARFWSLDGDVEEASRCIEAAARLDPLLPWWQREIRGMVFYAGDHHRQVVAEVERMPRRSLWSAMFEAASASAMGDVAKARHAIAHARAIKPDVTADWIEIALPFSEAQRAELFTARLHKAGLP
jgi:adenylate cyclase